MGLLCKRYDMIALLLQAAPKVHHNLPKAIITLNSPEAIIAGDLLCGRLAKKALFLCILKEICDVDHKRHRADRKKRGDYDKS